MRTAIGMWLAFLSALCLAQPPDGNQKLLEEVKGIHATLNRLVQLMDAFDKTQRATLALQQIQVYDGQVRTLQAQQDSLAAQERKLARNASALGDSARAAASGADPTGAPGEGGSADGGYRRDVSERLAAATRLLDETRGRKQAIEREISGLRERISQLEKVLEPLLTR